MASNDQNSESPENIQNLYEEMLLTHSLLPSYTSPQLLNNVLRELHQHVESSQMAHTNSVNAPNLLTRQSSTQSTNADPTADSVIINMDSILNRNPGYIPNSHVGLENSRSRTTDPTTPDERTFGNTRNANEPTTGNGNGDGLHNVIEIQHTLELFQKYLPFVLILIAKSIYDHCNEVLYLAIVLGTFIHANSIVKREATKRSRRTLSKLFVTLLYVFASVAFIIYVYKDEKLHLNLMFIRPPSSTVWELLWTCVLTDFILKLITIAFKIILTMLSAKIIPFQKRGKIYLFMESISQLFRSLTTIQPWLYYLLESYDGAEKVIGVILSAAYMVSKGSDLMCRLRLLKTSTLKLIQNVTLGSSPNKDQIETAGSNCPICHDEYDTPVLLQCRHIFCESCVSIWFDREQTCPLCRAKIVDDPSWKDGSTTYFVQLF